MIAQGREIEMNFNTADVEGLRLFYREAGDPSKPTIVLLHGFPSSSYHFHDLIPLLADRFHIIAPDYPGMGFSDAPDPTVLQPTFDDVAMAIDALIAQRAPGPLIWAIDAYAFSVAANRVLMSRLFMNLTTNIQHYPEWTAYLKDRQPKTLIVWGRNDPLILPAAAEFVKQVVPAADLRYFDGGHFVLDEYADAIAEAIIKTFSR
jgi:pimeloyl-ACP methyl ester carboxylesterase